MMRLKEFRELNNLLQTDIGDYLSISKSFVSQVEKGKVKLPREKFNLLLNNNKGWDTTPLTEEAPEATLFEETPQEETPPEGNIGTMVQSIQSLCESIKSLVEINKEEGKRTDKVLEILQQELDKKRG